MLASYFFCSDCTLQSGIYITHADFVNHKLSYTKADGSKYRFKANRTFHSGYIKVIRGDSAYHINKDSIYGYIDTDKSTYRIFEKKEYKIINPSEEILLYSTVEPIYSKGNQATPTYYFSANSTSNIYPLTKLNLKRAFPNNTKFHELIDMYFHSNDDLMTYDDFYHTYKINHIYTILASQK